MVIRALCSVRELYGSSALLWAVRTFVLENSMTIRALCSVRELYCSECLVVGSKSICVRELYGNKSLVFNKKTVW
jgi:hypothetical protein